MGLCRWGSCDVASPGWGLKLALTLLRITLLIFLPSRNGGKARRPSPGADTLVTAFPATGTVRINVFLFAMV